MENVYVVISNSADNKITGAKIVDTPEEAKIAYVAAFDAAPTDAHRILTLSRVAFYENLCSGYKLSTMLNEMNPVNPLSL